MAFQIIVTLFVIFTLWGTLQKYKQNKISGIHAIVWAFFWLIVIIVLFYPNVLNRLADAVGIGRGVDVVIYLSLLGLYFLVFKIFIKLRAIEQRMTKMVQKQAIETGAKLKEKN